MVIFEAFQVDLCTGAVPRGSPEDQVRQSAGDQRVVWIFSGEIKKGKELERNQGMNQGHNSRKTDLPFSVSKKEENNRRVLEYGCHDFFPKEATKAETTTKTTTAAHRRGWPLQRQHRLDDVLLGETQSNVLQWHGCGNGVVMSNFLVTTSAKNVKNLLDQN